MISPIFAVIAGAAITTIFTLGSIFAGVRARGPRLWRELASCPLCAGWWVGAALDLPNALTRPIWPAAVHLVAVGSLTGCAALLYRRIIDRLD